MSPRTIGFERTSLIARPSPAPPPRWARIAAHAAAITPLPSAVWRLLLVFGFSAGFTEQGLLALNVAGWGWVHLVALSVLTELAALPTLGLVQPWGEVVPRWVPHLGGRRIPSRPVVLLASVGAAVLFALWTPLLHRWTYDHSDMTTTGVMTVGLRYLQLVAWSPLLAAVTASNAKRHRASNLGSR